MYLPIYTNTKKNSKLSDLRKWIASFKQRRKIKTIQFKHEDMGMGLAPL